MNRLVRALPVLLVAPLVGACPGPTRTPNQESTTMPASEPSTRASDCGRALRALIVEGDLASGHGLPTGCTRAEVEGALGAKGTPGSGRLSRLVHPWVKYALGGDTEARVWYDRDTVILIDVGDPRVRQSVDELSALLGAPEEIIDARVNGAHSEWIFASRGLTVAVAPAEDAAASWVSWLFLYPPTTLDDYVQRLGGKDEWVKRRPAR